MNILYIWDADYPWDIRVEKICKTLINNGNDVHIAARNLKRLPEYEKVDGLHINRLKPYKNDKTNYILSFPAFFSPVWRGFLDNIIRTNDIDLIIVRDLPMSIAGIWAGKRNNIPVIFDMAEDYVAMIRDIWKIRKFQGVNFFIRNPFLAKCVEKFTFRHADHIWVVVEEAIEVVKKGGGALNKISIVSNTPLIEQFNGITTLKNNHIDLIKSRFSIIYTGGVQMGRGIQLALDAIPELIETIPDVLFVVVGDGYAKEELNRMVEEKSLQDYILWVGWISHNEVYDYIKASNIGIIPHFVTDHVNTTVPNKIFDYMGCGLPVVASDAVPMKRILEEEKAGLVFKNKDANDLVRAVKDIYFSEINFSDNGIEAVKTKYHWENNIARIIKSIELVRQSH